MTNAKYTHILLDWSVLLDYPPNIIHRRRHPISHVQLVSLLPWRTPKMGDLTDRESTNPWTSATVLSGRAYQEPDMNDDEGDDISQATMSYPPPSQNPFNQSRPTAQRIAIGEKSSESGSFYLDQGRIDDSTVGTTPAVDPVDDSAIPIQQDPMNRIVSPNSGLIGRTYKNEHVILGIAVVDFNHLVGPTVDWSYPPSLTKVLSKDEELTRLLPFLALPDGAHLVSGSSGIEYIHYRLRAHVSLTTRLILGRVKRTILISYVPLA
jgi:hypothetical protein